MRSQIILPATGLLLACGLVACNPGPMDPGSQPEGEPAAAGVHVRRRTVVLALPVLVAGTGIMMMIPVVLIGLFSQKFGQYVVVSPHEYMHTTMGQRADCRKHEQEGDGRHHRGGPPRYAH